MRHHLMLAWLLLMPAAAHAQTYSVLYEWQTADYDWNPNADMLVENGTIFGTIKNSAAYFENLKDTGCGGYGCGSVYRLAGAAVTTLHAFAGSDGGMPIGGVIRHGSMLFGTTSFGGSHCKVIAEHCGTIFALNPQTGALVTLHAFSGLTDGGGSFAKLLDYGGMLYGTTAVGGIAAGCGGQGCGTVFRLNPETGLFTVLHRFTSADATGLPEAALTQMGGAVYGTTLGYEDAGALFKLDPTTGAVTFLHRFGAGADGLTPSSNLVGNRDFLYGTTKYGGANGSGTLYKLNVKTHVETILFSFEGGLDGYYPSGPITKGGGILYGAVAYSYGAFPYVGNAAGNIYQLDVSTGKVAGLMGFASNNGVNGLSPLGVTYQNGALYGIMMNSGGDYMIASNVGVPLGLAFQLVP